MPGDHDYKKKKKELKEKLAKIGADNKRGDVDVDKNEQYKSIGSNEYYNKHDADMGGYNKDILDKVQLKNKKKVKKGKKVPQDKIRETPTKENNYQTHMDSKGAFEQRALKEKVKKAELTGVVKEQKKKKGKERLVHKASKGVDTYSSQDPKNSKVKKKHIKGKVSKQLIALRKKVNKIKNNPPQGPSGGTADTPESIIKDAEAVAKTPSYIAKDHDHAISFKGYKGESYKRASLISNTGKYAKYWLLNAKQTNGNGWGVSQQSIAKNIHKFVGKPLVVTAKSWIPNSEYGDAYEHPYLPTNDINKVFDHQEKFRVGSIVDIIEKDGDYYANIEINQKFAHMVMPPFCSPAIFQNNPSEPEGQISDWEALHLAALHEDPAYGSRIALLRGTCVGTQDQCTVQFKAAKQEAKMVCTKGLKGRLATLKKNDLKQRLSSRASTPTNSFGEDEGDNPDDSINMYRQNIGPGSIKTQPNLEVKRQKSIRKVDGGIPKPRWMKTRDGYQGNYQRPLPEFEEKIPSNRGINYTGETRDDKFKKIIVPRTKEDIEDFKGQNWREGETREELEAQGMYDKEQFRTRYKDIKKNIPASMVENTAPEIPGSVYSVGGHPKGMSEAAFKRELQTDYKDHRVGVNKNKRKSKAEKRINKELKDLRKEYTSVRINRREYSERHKDLMNELAREEALRKGDTRGYRDNKSPFHEPVKAIAGEYDYEVENIADEEDIVSSGAYDEQITESFQDNSFASIKGGFESGTMPDEYLSEEFTRADREKALDGALQSAANYIPNANNMSRTELMELLEYIFDNDIESFSDPAVMSISRQNAQRWSKLKQRIAGIQQTAFAGPPKDVIAAFREKKPLKFREKVKGRNKEYAFQTDGKTLYQSGFPIAQHTKKGIKFSYQSHPSATTAQAGRMLGINTFTKKGKTYVNGKEIDPNTDDYIEVPTKDIQEGTFKVNPNSTPAITEDKVKRNRDQEYFRNKSEKEALAGNQDLVVQTHKKKEVLDHGSITPEEQARINKITGLRNRVKRVYATDYHHSLPAEKGGGMGGGIFNRRVTSGAVPLSKKTHQEAHFPEKTIPKSFYSKLKQRLATLNIPKGGITGMEKHTTDFNNLKKQTKDMEGYTIHDGKLLDFNNQEHVNEFASAYPGKKGEHLYMVANTQNVRSIKDKILGTMQKDWENQGHPNTVLGGWKGQIDLNAVFRAKDSKQALEYAKKYNQEAITEINSVANTVNFIDNPSYKPKTQ